MLDATVEMSRAIWCGPLSLAYSAVHTAHSDSDRGMATMPSVAARAGSMATEVNREWPNWRSPHST